MDASDPLQGIPSTGGLRRGCHHGPAVGAVQPPNGRADQGVDRPLIPSGLIRSVRNGRDRDARIFTGNHPLRFRERPLPIAPSCAMRHHSSFWRGLGEKLDCPLFRIRRENPSGFPFRQPPFPYTVSHLLARLGARRAKPGTLILARTARQIFRRWSATTQIFPPLIFR